MTPAQDCPGEGQVMQRKLAAILAADVVGYSRLMSEDEAGTMMTLRSRRKEILEPAVAQRHGRIFKLMGDCVFVEFASAVNAVACAIDLQKGMADRNAKDRGGRPVHLRVGINLGDVVVEDGDLYGDGVNIAARLEGLAEGGGICLSGTAYDQIEGKLPLDVQFVGQHSVKNIARPVRTFRILARDMEGRAAAGTPASVARTTWLARSSGRVRASAPLPARATAERRVATMTASGMNER